MTPKEKIYAKTIDIQNEERSILGLASIDKEKSLANGFARNHTIKELEEELSNAQISLTRVKKKAAKEAYFNTPEGMELKCRLEKEINDASAMLLKAHADMAISLQDFTMKHLGYRWIIRNFNDRCLSIEFNDKAGKPIFGMRIEVFYAIDFADPEMFTMSHTSASDFDPTADYERHEYIKGLFTITKEDVASELKKMLKAYSRFCNEYHTEIDNLKNQLNNPPIDE